MRYPSDKATANMGLLYSVFLHFISFLFDIVRWQTHIVLYFLHLGRKQTVPEATNPYLLTSATELANMIRKGKVKCEDVIKAYINRIKEVEPFINATVDTRFSEAIDEAKAVDELITSNREKAENLETEKPLLGVPLSVKNLIPVKGLQFTCGSYLLEDRVAQKDAKVVDILRKAGAIVLCNTNCPEFGLCLDTFNRIHGRTRNPHDTTRSVGATSGGEGALVSAAGSLVGLGNDLAGSVRLPALYTGIFAHKPTAGLVSNEDSEPDIAEILPYLTPGPMCRYAEDLLLSMKVLTRHQSVNLKIGEPVDFGNIKIYYWYDRPHLFSPKPDAETIDRIEEVLSHFQKTFNTRVERLDVKEMKQSTGIFFGTLCAEIGKSLEYAIERTGKKFDSLLEFVKYFLGQSQLVFLSIIVINAQNALSYILNQFKSKTDERRAKLNTELEERLTENSVLIMPTAAKPSLYPYEFIPSLHGIGFTAIFNILGNPSTHCPIGRNRSGHPLGLQVVGKKFNDNLTMTVGLEIERTFGGWIAPNPKK